MSLTTPDSELDAAALLRAIIAHDREGVSAIARHADLGALLVELADLAAAIILGACDMDEAEAIAVIDEHQHALITGNGGDSR